MFCKLALCGFSEKDLSGRQMLFGNPHIKFTRLPA
jgi:hypothetical protein